MKKFLLLAVCLPMVLGNTFAQSAAQEPTPWTLHSEVSGVKIYFASATCAENSVLFLKIENTGLSRVAFSYELLNGLRISAPGEAEAVTLKGGETLHGACGSFTPPSLMVFTAAGTTPEFKFSVKPLSD